MPEFADSFPIFLERADALVRQGQCSSLKRDVCNARRGARVIDEFIDYRPGLGAHRCAGGIHLLGSGDLDVWVQADEQGQGGIAEFLAEGVDRVGVDVRLLATMLMVGA